MIVSRRSRCGNRLADGALRPAPVSESAASTGGTPRSSHSGMPKHGNPLRSKTINMCIAFPEFVNMICHITIYFILTSPRLSHPGVRSTMTYRQAKQIQRNIFPLPDKPGGIHAASSLHPWQPSRNQSRFSISGLAREGSGSQGSQAVGPSIGDCSGSAPYRLGF